MLLGTLGESLLGNILSGKEPTVKRQSQKDKVKKWKDLEKEL